MSQDKQEGPGIRPRPSSPHRQPHARQVAEAPPSVGHAADESLLTAEPFQLLPPLSEGEYAALRADIAENGVLVPITLDQVYMNVTTGDWEYGAYREVHRRSQPDRPGRRCVWRHGA